MLFNQTNQFKKQEFQTVKKKEQTDSMVITLENAIYMGMKNDLAFIIDTELFLYEHQSTYNPNMPLRDLFYISSEYQKLVDKKSLYSSVLQKIPAPQFIVFYNGTEKKKDSWVNHLSEAFENLSGNPQRVLLLWSVQSHALHACRDGLDQKALPHPYLQTQSKSRKHSRRQVQRMSGISHKELQRALHRAAATRRIHEEYR